MNHSDIIEDHKLRLGGALLRPIARGVVVIRDEFHGQLHLSQQTLMAKECKLRRFDVLDEFCPSLIKHGLMRPLI